MKRKQDVAALEAELEVLQLRRSQLDVDIEAAKARLLKAHATMANAVEQALSARLPVACTKKKKPKTAADATKQALRSRLPRFLHAELLPALLSLEWCTSYQDVGDGTGKTRRWWRCTAVLQSGERTTASGFVRDLHDDDEMGMSWAVPDIQDSTAKRAWKTCKQLNDQRLDKAIVALVLMAARKAVIAQDEWVLDNADLLLRYDEY